MPVTTFLHDGELNQPTGDAELDGLLAEARAGTGSNYQVVTHKGVEALGFLGLRHRVVERVQLYVEVGGMGPWQVLTCAHDVPTIKAFLLGLINGVSAQAAQPEGKGAMKLVPVEGLEYLQSILSEINHDTDGDNYLNDSADGLEAVDELLAAAPAAPVGVDEAQAEAIRARRHQIGGWLKALEQIASETSASTPTEAADRFQRIARAALAGKDGA